MTPQVSVIVPAYNRFKMLLPVVEAILGQTVPVFEVLIVDDGSEDETPEQLPRCIEERPGWKERVRYIRQENQGQSAALNRGIEESRSEWLGFCAHDDLWLPWKLEWQFRAVETAGQECGLCFTDAWFMNNPHMKQSVFQFSGRDLPGVPTGEIAEPVAMVVGRHPVWVQTVIARKDVIRQAGSFDPLLRYSEDHDFVFRMALITHFCYVNLPLVLIDRSPARIRHTGAAERWHELEFCLQMDQRRFEKQLAVCGNLSPAVCKSIRRNLKSLYSHWATHYLEVREFGKAREALRAACSYELSVALAIKRLLTIALPQLARTFLVARDHTGGPRYDRTSWETGSAK